jgi:hypothetical protein
MKLTRNEVLARLAEGWTLKCGWTGPWLEKDGTSEDVHYAAFRSLHRKKEVVRLHEGDGSIRTYVLAKPAQN